MMVDRSEVGGAPWILLSTFLALCLLLVLPVSASAETKVIRKSSSDEVSRQDLLMLQAKFESLRSDEITSSGSNASTSSSKAARRCKHKKSAQAKRRCISNLKWYFRMPVGTARSVSSELVNDMRNNTSPDEYDETVIPPSTWTNSGVGTCTRQSFSRVSCVSLIWAYFDVVDDYGNVVGEDTFTCGWDYAVWYPYAKRPKLKTNAYNADCFWDSEL